MLFSGSLLSQGYVPLQFMIRFVHPFIPSGDCWQESGFRRRHSTEHAILDIISRIQSYMDKKLFSCGVFIDLSKAFDTVDHDILLGKLNHYGIRGVVNKWFASYLKGRFQTTKIKNSISEKREILCGVPLGSVLGPLLFLVYLNDICNSSNLLLIC